MTEIGASISLEAVVGAEGLYAGRGKGPDPSEYALNVARVTVNPDTNEGSVVGEDPRKRGMCLNYPSEVFYPHSGSGVKAAKKICDICRVKDECLVYALANGENFGVWGSKSERERKAILKTQNQ